MANAKQVPPPGKGSLYLRPLLIGSGAVLGLAPAPEYTFLIYASPVRNYFKVCETIHLFIAHCSTKLASYRIVDNNAFNLIQQFDCLTLFLDVVGWSIPCIIY